MRWLIFFYWLVYLTQYEFTVASLFFFGGTTIHDFSFALLIGLIVGSYSSIFVASPLLAIKWSKNQ